MCRYKKKYALKIHVSTERIFGSMFFLFFFLLSIYQLTKQQDFYLWSLIIAIFFLLLTILIPQSLKPICQIWIKLGKKMHVIVSPIILGFIFFLVITPMGLALRFFGKDLIRLHFDPNMSSYWIKRNPPGPLPDSLKNQF